MSGPTELGPTRASLLQALERNGGLDLLLYDETSGNPVHGVQRLTTNGGLQLGPLMTLDDRVYSLALAGNRIAALRPISDKDNYEHDHFQIYDSSYALLSDVDIDDGHHTCKWGALACDAHRCFATCNGYDGPRFVGFDTNGVRTFGPDDQNNGAVEGNGAVLATGCGFVTLAQDRDTSTTTARFGAPDEDVPAFLLDRKMVFLPYFISTWPYDASSIAWFDWDRSLATLSRMRPDGVVSVLDQGVIPTPYVALVPTSLGLLVVSGDQKGQPPNVVTHFDARLIDANGAVTAETHFDGGFVIDQVVAGETPDGIVVAWNQQRQAPPVTTNDDSINAVLLACASP